MVKKGMGIMKNFFKEFKQFAMRGNVLDMAVGVVVGSAFTAIVNSLVQDIFTPIISALTGKTNFENLTIEIGNAQINYGNFLNAVISFLIVSFSIFCMLKVINKLIREKDKQEEVKKEPIPTNEELLLTEIRDLLKEREL